MGYTILYVTRIRSVECGISPIATRYVMLCYDVITSLPTVASILATQQPPGLEKSHFLNCWHTYNILTVSKLSRNVL